MSQSPDLSIIDRILAKADDLLKGEVARAIGYGAALVVVLVVAISNAVGFTRFGDNIDITTALVGVGAAITMLVTLIESIRRYVFSANTVAAIQADPSTDVSEQGNG